MKVCKILTYCNWESMAFSYCNRLVRNREWAVQKFGIMVLEHSNSSPWISSLSLKFLKFICSEDFMERARPKSSLNSCYYRWGGQGFKMPSDTPYPVNQPNCQDLNWYLQLVLQHSFYNFQESEAFLQFWWFDFILLRDRKLPSAGSISKCVQ